jgi:hypothetical protein
LLATSQLRAIMSLCDEKESRHLNVREHIAEPVPDQAKLRKLLPLANEIYRLREAGIPYDSQLKRVAKLVGRIIDESMVAYAFGTGEDYRHVMLLGRRATRARGFVSHSVNSSATTPRSQRFAASW